MRVQFDYSEDELVEGSMRFMMRSKSVRTWQWQGYFTTALVMGVLGFAFFPWAGNGALGIAAALALFGAAMYHMTYREEFEKRVRKLCRERIAEGWPLSCEVELSPVGVEIRQRGTQTTHEWEEVAEVIETADSVDIFTRSGGGVIVRQRAFASPAARQEFVNLARSYLALARPDEQDTAQAVGGGDDLRLE